MDLLGWLTNGLTPGVLAWIAVAVTLGGVVKGVLGVGLPLVVVPLLSLVLPTPTAIGMLVVPMLFSNIWQAWEGGNPVLTFRRFYWLIATIIVTTILTVWLTVGMSAKSLNTILGLVVLGSVALMTFHPNLQLSTRQERIASPIAGVLAGLVSGVSSMIGAVLITYLMALKLERDQFVGCISVLYLCGGIPLYASMLVFGTIGIQEVIWSALALGPLLVGMGIGKWVRKHMSAEAFRRALLMFLVVVALILLLK